MQNYLLPLNWWLFTWIPWKFGHFKWKKFSGLQHKCEAKHYPFQNSSTHLRGSWGKHEPRKRAKWLWTVRPGSRPSRWPGWRAWWSWGPAGSTSSGRKAYYYLWPSPVWRSRTWMFTHVTSVPCRAEHSWLCRVRTWGTALLRFRGDTLYLGQIIVGLNVLGLCIITILKQFDVFKAKKWHCRNLLLS